jgi:tetratricopeptide (TPR) repeat protein
MLESCLYIRQSLLDEDHIEIANVLLNMANLETAEGNLEAAIGYADRSASICEAKGTQAATLLASTHLCLGRVYFLQEDFPQAYLTYQKCERVLNRLPGRNKMRADLQYAYGNLEFAQGQYEDAARSYELTRQISKDFNPMHPLTAAACYKLACTEFEQDNHKKALNYLSKALDIAELRGSSEVDGMDGTVVRILFKRAEVLLDDPLGGRVEGTQLMNDMLFRRKDVADKLEVDLGGYDMLEDRERGFDLLVPGYFR